jgi:hypothetical protein
LADAAAIGIAPQNPRAALVEANKDEILYEITFDLPDAGLEPDIEPTIPPVQLGNATAVNVTNYDLSQSRRSVVEHQLEPVAPRVPIAHCTRLQASRMNFLQLRQLQMRRSVLEARQYARMTKEESVGWDARIVMITKLGERVAITKLGEWVAITKLGEQVAITKLGEQVAGNTKLEWWSFVYLLP